MSLGETLKKTRQSQLRILTENDEDFLESVLPFSVGDPVIFLHQPSLRNRAAVYFDQKCGIITEIVEVGGVPGSGDFWANVKVVWKLKTGRVSIPITRFWHEDPERSAVELVK